VSTDENKIKLDISGLSAIEEDVIMNCRISHKEA
jgi:hypothetical protein